MPSNQQLEAFKHMEPTFSIPIKTEQVGFTIKNQTRSDLPSPKTLLPLPHV
ncbi:hypothetical protein PMEGAS228_14390 [Priestia megaterium]